ncbi:hypothetical protein B0H17DRAFT_1202070 [Mycena rosella]|uniref:BTB domain-containing protein n=1 Tax=Mycena rosella TaxID=1033263 RepID=A0AAD7GDP8_MYCRO|nr:hypothetical protein B0H17DRAFT_1202070 [Mycena rosella]
MEVDTEPSEPHRVEELWFEDGNIVLQAGNSQFRVYRGILAARSPVFKDMLSFPQPPESELVEGCPLVRFPDAENEVTDFLKAIFTPDYFPAFPSRTEFAIIAGCLRLSHKYEVDYLRRHALIHLSSRYCTTLSEYDSRVLASPNDRHPDHHSARAVLSWPLPPTSTSFGVFTIQLAREVEALWILPQAFYDLSTCFLDGKGAEIFHGTVYNGTPTSLCFEDQTAFLHGHSIHTKAVHSIMRFLSYPLDVAGCGSPLHCSRARLQAIEDSRAMVCDCSDVPLAIWDGDDWEDYLGNVCPACWAVLESTHAEARHNLWDNLPKTYGLPAWEELEKMKVTAIGNSFHC